MARIDTVTAQFAYQRVGDEVVRGQHGDAAGAGAELRERNRNIRFRSAESGYKLRRLQEALESGRRETNHYLAESRDNRCH